MSSPPRAAGDQPTRQQYGSRPGGNALAQLYALLTPAERRNAWTLLGLMLVGMVVDTLGIGLVVPALGVLIESDPGSAHPRLQPVLDMLGNPGRAQLVVGGMLALVGAFLFRTAFLGYLAWRQTGFAYGVQAELSHRLLRNYLSQPYTFHLQRNSAQLIRNATREVEVFTLYCLINALLIGTEGLVAIGVAVLLLVIEPVGALSVAAAMAGAAGIFSLATRRRVAAWGTARQEHEGVRLQRLQEAIGGVKDVMVLGREAEFLRRYQLHNAASAALAQRHGTVLQLPRLWLELLAVLGLAALVLSMLARGREVSSLLPTLGLFAVAGFRLLPSINRTLTGLQGFRYGRPTITVLHEELSHAPPCRSPPTSAGPGLSREIRLASVGYTYPGAARPSLSDVEILIGRGESVGIIGPSGAGKSTLVDVCLGLLQPTVGAVQVDGVDIRDNLRGWQNQIGYVPQSVYLTDDTLRRNIAFGLPDAEIDEAAVWRAVRDAQLEDFVLASPDGVDTLVGERGTSLSGGQRQRVGIARALYRDPAVLVLDEATSALDTETERGVLRAVDALRGRKTMLIVAHRLSTLAACDRIVRLENGRVAGQGRPEQAAARLQGGRSSIASTVVE